MRMVSLSTLASLFCVVAVCAAPTIALGANAPFHDSAATLGRSTQ